MTKRNLVSVLGLAVLTSLPGLATTIFNYTGAIQTYLVPLDGIYNLSAAGAQGGSNPSRGRFGGSGAYLSGDVYLTQNTLLYIVVGGQGSTNGAGNIWGSGGGGTFIYSSFSDLLMAAGGGGGAFSGLENGLPGLATSTNGSTGGTSFGTTPGAGGVNGFGGGGSVGTCCGNGTPIGAGGGAGWFGPGGDGNAVVGSGGSNFPTFAGGISTVNGGFGGGGGANFNSTGGGGGYSGGGSGGQGAGGGGGSFIRNDFTNIVRTDGSRAGNGEVTITQVQVVPEPGTYALLGFGLAMFWAVRRKRKHQSRTTNLQNLAS